MREIQTTTGTRENKAAGLKPSGNGQNAALVTKRVTVPDPEVLEKATRRRFTAQYKLRILKEADACSEPGEIGALLRREGLYSSHLMAWRRQREQGALSALTPRKRGRRPLAKNPLKDRLTELARENQRLLKRLAQAEKIIEVQKKISEILGISTEEKGSTENK